ncbi:MAG: DUF6476 family protein [Paracoccaceae bacterium]
MNNTPEPEALPPSLRLLKWLVIILTATMIVGVITVVGLLVTRMPDGTAPVAMPENLILPEGSQPAALTMGRDFIAVVTKDDRILIFGRDGLFRQEIRVAPATQP